jgi:hypothetical protein
VDGIASFEAYVEAFYTTPLFKIERGVLRWLAARPSSDDQARELARGGRAQFAAWTVEGRAPNQLLLADYTGRTRSWLMTAPGSPGEGTRLYFGSAVVARKDPKTGRGKLGFTFDALLRFHKLYSRLLLGSARSRLQSRI